MRYPVTISMIENEYVATISHPNGRFQGACSAASKKAVLKEAEKMVEAVIASALQHDEDIPHPSECDAGNDSVVLSDRLVTL